MKMIIKCAIPSSTPSRDVHCSIIPFADKIKPTAAADLDEECGR